MTQPFDMQADVAAQAQQPAAPAASPPTPAPLPGAAEAAPAAGTTPGAPPTPAAPAGPQFVGVAALKDIPHEDMTKAYTSGAWAPRADEKVPVSYDGQIKLAPADKLQAAVEHGAEIVHPDIARKVALERQFGEHGTLGATVAGAARGLTFGGSDFLATEAADAVGGDAAKAEMQDRLKYYQEEHPVASTVGELGGMVIPGLLTGGAGEAVEGAGLVARAARVLGAPAEGLGAIGRGAAGLAERVVGSEGESALARAAQSAVTHAASFGAEGAAMGLGQEISEASLDPDQNHAFTAEKLFSALGHGAVLNAALGGALGAGGKLAGEALDYGIAKASPYLSSAAETQAWKSLSPMKKFTEEAEARVKGGREAVGRVLLEAPTADGAAVIPATGSLASAAMTPEELLPRISSAKDIAGQKIAGILDQSGAKVSVRELNDQIESVIAPLRKKAGFEPVVKSVESYRDSLLKQLGHVETEIPAVPERSEWIIPPALEPKRSLVEMLTKNADKATGKGAEDLGAQLEAMGVEKQTIPAVPASTTSNLAELNVPIKTMFEQKRALGDLVYKEAKALDPSLRIEHLRDIYGKMSDVELETIDRAAKDAGSAADGAALKQARHTYQSLSLAEKAAEKSTAAYATNRNLGLSEYMTAGMAAASGHILAAPVVAAAHKIARARGNALLAATFDRLSVLQSVAKKSQAMDAELNRGIKAFVSRAKGEEPKAAAKAAAASGGAKSQREQYEQTVAKLKATETVAPDFAAPVAALAGHAPNVAGQFAGAAKRTTAWLLSRVPPTPKFGSKTPSDQDVWAFNQEAAAAEAPVQTLAAGLAGGNLSKRQVDAIQVAAPETYAKAQQILTDRMQAALAKDQTLPWDVRRDMALLFGIDTDWSMTQQGVATLQQNAKQEPSEPNPQKPAKRGAETKTPEASMLQTPEERREGGQVRAA